jgi:hypothetical protein
LSAPDHSLPASFWENVSESRRRRIQRRTRRRAARSAFFGGIAGFLVAHGIITSNIIELFWGLVIAGVLVVVLLYVTSPRRMP